MKNCHSGWQGEPRAVHTQGTADEATASRDMTATINNRSFQITENTAKLANLRADLIARGFDGTIWQGFSARTGRQRKDLHSMLYRTVSGEFVIAASF